MYCSCDGLFRLKKTRRGTETEFSIKDHHFSEKGFPNKKNCEVLKLHMHFENKLEKDIFFIRFLVTVILKQAKYQTQQNNIFYRTHIENNHV